MAGNTDWSDGAQRSGRPADGGSGAGGSGARLSGGVVGDASSVQRRTERGQVVWTFRLERYDQSGNRLQPVPVELRAVSVSGEVSDGDRVEVHGPMRAGTLHSQQFRNLTTGAIIQGARAPGVVLGIAGAVFVAIFIAAVIVLVLVASVFFGMW